MERRLPYGRYASTDGRAPLTVVNDERSFSICEIGSQLGPGKTASIVATDCGGATRTHDTELKPRISSSSQNETTAATPASG
jgi:hypothetical protein